MYRGKNREIFNMNQSDEILRQITKVKELKIKTRLRDMWTCS